MKADEVVKSIKCCISSPKVGRCKSECIFFRNDLDMSKCIKAMGETSADLLEQLQAENEILKRGVHFKVQYGGRFRTESEVVRMLDELKANQPVRCKDCVKRKTEDCSMYYECECGEQHTWEVDDDYCSVGERRVEE